MPLDHHPSSASLAPGGAVVFSDRAMYETYNFHDPEALEQLASWLARDENDDGSGVAVVAGRGGSGRDYLVRAAAWRAGERGTRVRHARLSFDGFDPDHHASLAAFVDHQLRMHFAPGGGELPAPLFDRRATLLGLAGSLPGAFLSAAGLSFLVAVGLSIVDVKALMGSGVPTLAGPRGTPEDHLRVILDLATRMDRLVLVLSADQLPEPVVQWFVHEPRRNRRLSVVLCTASAPDGEVMYGEPLAHVAQLQPMTREVLRERVSLRFAPNEFPNRFFSGLWKRTQGVPGQVALAMLDLDRQELITRGEGPGRPWSQVVQPDDERLVEYFASHFYDKLNQIRDRRRPIDLHVVRFVELAALCGSVAPPRLIASYMGLTDTERDDLLDHADELEDAGRPVLTSLDYRHPSFRNEQFAPELVYRFADESNRLIVLRRMIHKAREARGLLAYLSSRLPVVARATAELLATLASHLEEGAAEGEECARRLHWWTSAEEAEALTDLLSEQVRRGELMTEVLWAEALHRQEWLPLRRLALLDAMRAAPDGIPLDILPAYHDKRAFLLIGLGRYQEALIECRAGLKMVGTRDYSLALSLHSSACFCCRWHSDWHELVTHAREVYSLTRMLYGFGTLDAAEAASLLAVALVKARRPTEATRHLDEAMEIVSQLPEEAGIHVGSVMNTIGVALDDLGRNKEAIECHRKSLELDEAFELPSTHRLMKLYALGQSLRSYGNLEEAYLCFEAAVDLATELSTPGHVAYGGSLLELLHIDFSRGNEPAACAWAERLLALVQTERPEVLSRVSDAAGTLMPEQYGQAITTALPGPVRELMRFLRESQVVLGPAPGPWTGVLPWR